MGLYPPQNGLGVAMRQPAALGFGPASLGNTNGQGANGGGTTFNGYPYGGPLADSSLLFAEPAVAQKSPYFQQVFKQDFNQGNLSSDPSFNHAMRSWEQLIPYGFAPTALMLANGNPNSLAGWSELDLKNDPANLSDLRLSPVGQAVLGRPNAVLANDPSWVGTVNPDPNASLLSRLESNDPSIFGASANSPTQRFTA
jgi:hypothetical protein